MHLHIYSSYLFLENRKNIIFCKKKKTFNYDTSRNNGVTDFIKYVCM